MNLAGTTLRLARRSDAPTLAAMSRDLIETGLGWHYRTERIGQLLGNADTVSLVACENACAAGFAIMTLGEERAHLVLLAVRADYHRRGIGRRLTQWLVETAVTAGITTLHVELRAQNKAAYLFYRALGFRANASHRGLLSWARNGDPHDAPAAHAGARSVGVAAAGARPKAMIGRA